MSPKAEELLESVMALPVEERMELVDAVMTGSDDIPLQFDPETLEEIRRRSAAIDAGESICTPWEIVRERVRKRVEARHRG